MTAVTPGAAGRVTTGFSYPYVARYAAAAGVISYSDAMELARGVSVQINPDNPDENTFWANNQQAESGPSVFRSGNVALTVDGLLIAARRFVYGLPAAGSDGWTGVGDNAQPPYVGIGYIQRWKSGGVDGYTPTIIVKTKFQSPSESAQTEGEDGIEWQTQDLTATIFRGDDADHSWKYIGGDFATEAEALTALRTKLGITSQL